MNMVLTPQLIEEAKKFFPKEAFQKCEKATAKHKLFQQFADLYPNWPKLIFYILMDELFPQHGMDGSDLGYMASFDPALIPEHLKPRMN
jgi:hypothetical protein